MAAAQISHCQTVGWPLSATARREESPGSTEVRCRVTPGGGDPRESATESTPPTCLGRARRAVRVKRCGKSAPRRRQRRRQGKPHREQDQVGAAGIPEAIWNAGRASEPPLGSVARGARRRASQRNGHRRLPGRTREAGQNPAYTPSGAARAVDASADQIGISAFSRGQPCASPISRLLVGADRVALPIVWSTRSVSRL
jgi:hypothetical protein